MGAVEPPKEKVEDPIKEDESGEYEDILNEDKGEGPGEDDYGDDFEESGGGKKQLEMKPSAGGISGYADDF